MTRSMPLPALWLTACSVMALGLVVLLPSGPPKIADIPVPEARSVGADIAVARLD